jgi:sec-independent protein translocase protein TatA
MLGGLGPTELIIVLAVILVVFGAGKLPDIASGLGKGLRDFKNVMQEPEEPETGDPSEGPPDETSPSGKKPEDA